MLHGTPRAGDAPASGKLMQVRPVAMTPLLSLRVTLLVSTKQCSSCIALNIPPNIVVANPSVQKTMKQGGNGGFCKELWLKIAENRPLEALVHTANVGVVPFFMVLFPFVGAVSLCFLWV